MRDAVALRRGIFTARLSHGRDARGVFVVDGLYGPSARRARVRHGARRLAAWALVCASLLAAGAGQIWSSDDDELGFFAYGRDGRAWISRPADVVEAGPRGVTDGVSGRPLIVDRGRISDELATFPRTYSREPRTAVGVSQDG